MWVPSNVEFQIDDIENVPWTFKSNTIDFIHIRNMRGSIKHWGAILRESIRIVKPGGWIEIVQLDFAADAPAWKLWVGLFKRFLKSKGHEANSSASMTNWIKETGFKELRPITAQIPGWPYAFDCFGKILPVLAGSKWSYHEIVIQAMLMKEEARSNGNSHFFARYVSLFISRDAN